MSIQNCGSAIELTAGNLLLVIDTATGSLTRIEDRKSKIVHLDTLKEGSTEAEQGRPYFEC